MPGTPPGVRYPRFGGKELFYVTIGNRLMAAQIHTQPTFGVDSIRPMFQVDFPNLPDRSLERLVMQVATVRSGFPRGHAGGQTVRRWDKIAGQS